MPTIYREDGRRYFFYSNERQEPPHVHVERDDGEGKFWLNPVAIANRGGLSYRDVAVAHAVILSHQAYFLERWRDHFGGA